MKKRHVTFKSVLTGLVLSGSLQAQELMIPRNDLYQPISCYTYDECCPPCTSYWVEAEYLCWQIKNSPKVVPLVGEGDEFDPLASPILGEPGTSVVLGDREFNNGWRSGGRFSLGTWFCNEKKYGTEISYLFLAPKSISHRVSSGEDGTPILFIPFFDAVTELESSTFGSAPNRFIGLARVKVENRMQGAEWNGLAQFGCYNGFDIQALAGFRWWNFNEKLTFKTESPDIGDPNSVFDTTDKFDTRNNFYGGQLGLIVGYNWNCFSIDVKGKVALGAINEQVNIKGELVTNVFAGGLQTFEGGYFALPTNIGGHSKTQFAVIPEVNVNIGYQISDRWSIKAGYSFLYVSRMLWASEQIDRNINPSQAPSIVGEPAVFQGVEAPKALLKSSHFWAQGVNVGLEFRF